MKTLFLLAVLVVSMALPASPRTDPTNPSPVPALEHYRLRFRIDPGRHTLSAEADLHIRNTADRAATVVPILLYRLMEVETASDAQGKLLAFAQKVVKFPDEPAWQVNQIQVTLPAPLAPGQAAAIHLKYAGPLFGYPEVMQYVRDTISEQYSLIRAETMAYPMIAAPSSAGWRQFMRNSKFDYEIETDVPAGFVAVCSGKESGEQQTRDGRSTYRCSGEPGSSQLTVAIARFRVLNDPERSLRVYALPADAEAGNHVMTEMRRALDFYRSYFGDMPGGSLYRGSLTLIEIPDGWGSYVSSGHIFQAAAAFKDRSRASELYHEVAHIWNALAGDRVVRTRWFDEAFASYFEALAVRQFQSTEAYRAFMERARQSFIQRAARDSRGRTTAIAEYGKEELGGFSYTKGAWSLYVLHQFLGEDQFQRSIAVFLAAYGAKPAEFDDFRRAIENSSGRDLQRWFEQWIASGTDSSALLTEGKSIEEMAARCQPAARQPP